MARLTSPANIPGIIRQRAQAAAFRCEPGHLRCLGWSGLDVGAHPGIAVTALVLAARSARARVIAPDAGELITRRRAPAGLDVRPAVDRRRGVLQLLGPTRRETGRQGGCLSLGWPGVGAALGGLACLAALVPLARLAALAALASLVPLARLAALAALGALGT
jgi:hypothetical protein